MIPDLLVLGAGPAALALCAEARGLGLDARVFAPDPEHPWDATYGAWADELPPGWEHYAEATWPTMAVRIDESRSFTLRRPYVRVDARRLQAMLLAKVPKEARLVGAAGEGELPSARMVVDATGARTPRVARRGPSNPAFQVAWGEIVERAPFEPTLMDFSGPDPGGPPSFLYALPTPDGRWFVEETVLAARPAPPMELLRDRLHARLARAGVEPGIPAERCVIPMGVALPAKGALASFGAAAGMIHPATGYSLARSLSAAPAAAAAIAAGLAHGGEAEARDRLLTTLWPADRARAWALYRFGLEVLLGLNLADTREFFATFFQHPAAVSAGWLSGELAATEVSRAMLAQFGRLGWGLRARLVAEALGPRGWAAVGEVMG